MAVTCPPFAKLAIVSDDAHLAASLSCAFGKRSTYLPVMDGPRLTRADGNSEIVRRINTIARSDVEKTLLAGLSAESEAAMLERLPKKHGRVVSSADVAALATDAARAGRPPLKWGADRLGLGVLTALYSGQLIEFSDEQSSRQAVPSKFGHVVICEAHEPLAEVIAANYAYALNAGLHIFDETDAVESQQLLEAYYSIDAPGVVPAAERARLRARASGVK